MEELNRLRGRSSKTHRVLAHLGSGSSLAAVRNTVSIDSTLGFTPSSGVMMQTSTGDIDPGFVLYLLQSGKLTPKKLGALVKLILHGLDRFHLVGSRSGIK